MCTYPFNFGRVDFVIILMNDLELVRNKHVCTTNLTKFSPNSKFYVNVLLHALSYLDVLSLKTRRQRLSELLGLFRVTDNKSVKVSGATDLELGVSVALADLDHLGIAPASLLKEVTDVGDLLGHVWKK